ncbi:MAG: sugar transferase [Schwartzia succinivorans]|nr:sugar transferase [Schwartzia succinivorans]
MLKVHLFLKRVFDIVSSAIAIAVFSPILLVLAIAVRLDSPGPIFFRQKRLTKDGREFMMYKFRSMVVNAEKMGTGLFNYENDPRVTKVGRFLRNNSADELPQLFNILKGDMAVIGPRPCVTYELGDFATLNKRYKKRFSVKAGLSGLAQVKGRNDISWDEKVGYDNEYVDLFQQYGILIDLWLVAETIVKAFRHEDIYEKKSDETMDDAEAAKQAEQEVIRLAHLPDEER